jgi:TonB-dependent SusC/RagA subfamily outer membrane receptor
VLYIVDGTKRDSVYMTRNVAPKDIYSISIYKGKSAVKTYGPKGGRGVIVIQTREAAKAAGMPGAGDTVRPRRAQAPSGETFSGTPAKVMIRGEKDSVPGNGGEVSLSRALVVVDGTIEDTGYLSRMAPHQIRSITVLKDPEAVSLFGDRGKNGAILIKTRKQTDSTRR